MLEKQKVTIKAFLDCKGKNELILPIIKKAVKLKPNVILIFQSSKIAATLMKNADKLDFNFEDAMFGGADLVYCKVYGIDRVQICKAPKLTFDLSWEEILSNLK